MIRLTRAQVREIDRRAIEQYHIPGIVLMENAARGATEVAMSMLGKQGARVAIVCGSGNNGGDGLAVARHLHNRGVDVQLFLTDDPSKYSGDALLNWRIVEAMSLRCDIVQDAVPLLDNFDLIVDAIFGTGLLEPIRKAIRPLIRTLNVVQAPVLAIDLPSGMDCDTGQPLGICVKATKTITFVAEKAGFAHRKFTGEVIVGDIGCPRELIAEVPISYHPRSKDEGKKIRHADGWQAVWTLIRYRFGATKRWLRSAPDRNPSPFAATRLRLPGD